MALEVARQPIARLDDCCRRSRASVNERFGEIEVPAVQQVPGRDAHDEERAEDEGAEQAWTRRFMLEGLKTMAQKSVMTACVCPSIS